MDEDQVVINCIYFRMLGIPSWDTKRGKGIEQKDSVYEKIQEKLAYST
jgi:hypothetical protein